MREIVNLDNATLFNLVQPFPCLSRPQDALIACKSKTIQASFDSLEDCFDYFSIVEPKVRKIDSVLRLTFFLQI